MKAKVHKKPQSKHNPAAKSASSVAKPRLPLVIAISTFALLVAAYFTVSGMMEQYSKVYNTLMEWTISYHLTGEQADRIRQIELRFHRYGIPFIRRESGKPGENDAHHLEISRVMNPEDGAHFLEAMSANSGRH